MHSRFFMKHFHRIHHVSTDPTPITSYTFQPGETLVEFGFLPLIILILPLHFSAFLTWQFIIISTSIFFHLGYEVLPRWWVTNPVTKYINPHTS